MVVAALQLNISLVNVVVACFIFRTTLDLKAGFRIEPAFTLTMNLRLLIFAMVVFRPGKLNRSLPIALHNPPANLLCALKMN